MTMVKQETRARAKMIEENAEWLEETNRENFVIVNKDLFKLMIEYEDRKKSTMTSVLGSALGIPDQSATRTLQRGLNYGLFVKGINSYQLSVRGEELFKQLRNVSV